MVLQELWQFMEKSVFVEPSTPSLFNQYNHEDTRFDRVGAATVRRANLKKYLASFAERPAVLLVGEAPGPRGCRFSGVPFTSEAQLVSKRLPFTGNQSSNGSKPFSEASATTVWSVLSVCNTRACLWNCVPFHPHTTDSALSVRAPSLAEIRKHGFILRNVVEMLEPSQIISIGKKAALALSELGITAENVRHPSRGGSLKFRAGMRELLPAARFSVA